MDNGINSLYEFGGFKFDPKKGKLWQNNELILLSPKAAELLSLLLERKGEFVEKEEIFETVWKDTFVEDGVLTQNIYTLRKALGNDEDGKPLIENKTRLGYRITVPISDATTLKQTDDETTRQQGSEKNQTEESKKFLSRFRIVMLSFALLAVFVLIGYLTFRPQITAFFRKPIESVKFTQITNTGEIADAALSNDGNLLAFVKSDKVFLKDVFSNKELPIDIPNVPSFSSLQFSSDGNFLYFRNNKSPWISAKILKVSRFGGDSQVVAEKAFASFSLSPDNKFLAYYARILPYPNPKLVIKNLETNVERDLYEAEGLLSICESCSPAWSPDGKKIIHVSQSWGNQPSQLIVLDTETGGQEPLKIPKFRRFEQAAWFPDGQSFTVSATEDGRFFHLFKVFYPNTDFQLLTNGLSSYKNTVISADGKKILALQTTEYSNIFTADAEKLTEQKPLTTGNSNNFGQNSLGWIDEQNILFSSQSEKDLVENLWAIDAEGRTKRQFTNETANYASSPHSNGKSVYFNVIRNGFAAINRANASGENQTAITNETDGGRRSPQISADGNWLYYIFRNKNRGKIMRRNLLDQKEEIFIENENVQCGYFLALSADGKFLACPNWQFLGSTDAGKYNSEIAVVSTENRDDIKHIRISNVSPNFRFSPDSKAIEFITALDSGTRIMRQGFDDPEPKPILDFPKESVFNFAWSKNGKQLSLAKGQQIRDAVLLTNFE